MGGLRHVIGFASPCDWVVWLTVSHFWRFASPCDWISSPCDWISSPCDWISSPCDWVDDWVHSPCDWVDDWVLSPCDWVDDWVVLLTVSHFLSQCHDLSLVFLRLVREKRLCFMISQVHLRLVQHLLL